jgi:MFS family permease
MVLSVIGLALAPETVQPPIVRPRYHPQGISISGDKVSYVMAAAGAFVGFAVFGLFTSLAPGFVAVTLHHPNRLLAGMVPFVTFGAAAVAQATTGQLGNQARMFVGIGAEVVGLVFVAAGMEAPNLAAFLIGGGLAGAGAGVLFKSAMASLLGSAEPAKRGQAAAGLFLVAYVGLAIPALGIGIANLYVSAQTAMLFFNGALLVILAVIAALAVRTPHASRSHDSDRVGANERTETPS